VGRGRGLLESACLQAGLPGQSRGGRTGLDRWGLRAWAERLVLHWGREAASEMGKEHCRWVRENVGEPKKETEGPALDEMKKQRLREVHEHHQGHTAETD